MPLIPSPFNPEKKRFFSFCRPLKTRCMQAACRPPPPPSPRRPPAGHHQRRGAAAEDDLLAEEIGLRLLLEGGFEHAHAGGAEPLGVGQRDLPGTAAGV